MHHVQAELLAFLRFAFQGVVQNQTVHTIKYAATPNVLVSMF